MHAEFGVRNSLPGPHPTPLPMIASVLAEAGIGLNEVDGIGARRGRASSAHCS